MSTTPNFASIPASSTATISAANTAFDGSGTIVTLITGATGGTRIDMLAIAASGTTTAGVVNLFISPTTAANTTANTHLLRSFSVTATTPSATVAPFQTVLSSQTAPELFPIFLPSGYTLRVSTTKAEGFRVTANGGDF